MSFTYEGEKDEKNYPHGQGLLTYSDGSTIQGAFENGRPHGFAVMKIPDRRYEGQFFKGAMHGPGTSYHPSSGVILFSGIFEANEEFKGMGTKIY